MWDSVKIELDKLKDPSKPDYGATAVELTSGAAAEEDFELEEDEDPEWHYDCIDFDDYESEVRRHRTHCASPTCRQQFLLSQEQVTEDDARRISASRWVSSCISGASIG